MGHSPWVMEPFPPAEPTELVWCVCGGSTAIRPDTGLCERCTAKTPQATQAWQDWRARCSERRGPRSNALPWDYCIACGKHLGLESQFKHQPYCTSKPHACECGRRYWAPWELRKHQTQCKNRGQELLD